MVPPIKRHKARPRPLPSVVLVQTSVSLQHDVHLTRDFVITESAISTHKVGNLIQEVIFRMQDRTFLGVFLEGGFPCAI